MMANLTLIISNWKYFVSLFRLLSNGATEIQIKRAINGIQKAFDKNQGTIKESREAAKDVNDSFRN